MEGKPEVCIVSSPRTIASIVPFSNMVDIINIIYGSLYVITGNEGTKVLKERNHISGYSVNYTPGKNILSRISGHLVLEWKIIREMLNINSHINIYLFFMAEGILLPMLCAKILRKPVVLILAGSSIQILDKNRDIYSRPLALIEYSNYQLTDRIIVYTPNVIAEWGLEKYKNKVFVAHEHFINCETFNIKKPLKDRKCLIGYIGRLSSEKGTLNFVKAISNILKIKNGIRFFIGGEGQLRKEIENYLNENNLYSNVEFSGWIPHNDLSTYLNEVKLLVLPSYTEGLPNIMLEAMACGTPVLATPVGAIPDIIKDENNGFIMENNSPDCIAQNIIRALEHPRSDQISLNGRTLIEKEFTFEKTVERYRRVLRPVI
jgi:glycosyltransferase involved in cell wall biosynthesis